MKVKLEWLSELVDLTGLSVADIVDKVSLYSVEVEGVNKIIDATNIVIGHVLTKNAHPDSDHLSVLTIDVGNEELQIVCGAPNVDSGQYVIVALVGAVLPGDFKIKKSKIRGVESYGMVCSLQELGIEKKYVSDKFADGIYYFDSPQVAGTDGAKALNLHDEVIELGITPNRGDLLSMIGVAYEVSAVFNRQLKPLVFDLVKAKGNDKVNVEIETDKCLTYYAQVINDVKIKPSPMWLTSRLIAFGIRPINNVVDITNYILALFGQPLHAFDYDLLGNKIVIRNAYPNEEIITLDKISRLLLDSDIVITDGKKPVALAGVMGGLDTEVSSTTKNLVIEAAVFDPLMIRKTSSRLNLRSESSIRFERGVDINRTKKALDYASYLFYTLAEGKVIDKVNFAGIKEVAAKKIQIKATEVENLLGIKVSKTEIINIIKSLDFEVDENLVVSVPNRRMDITIKEDIIEEIGRLYGYNKLPLTHPTDSMIGELTPHQKAIRKVKTTLSKLGLYETVTYSLTNALDNNTFSYNHKDNIKAIEILMPLSEDRKELRFGLIPSLLNVIKYNFSRKNTNLSIFEVGKVYYQTEENHEEIYLAGALANQFSATLWKQEIETVDFYLVKGILNNLFATLGYVADYKLIDDTVKELHPKRSAKIIVNDTVIGFVGQVHPQYAIENDLHGVYVFEIKLDLLLSLSTAEVKFSSINKLPSVERDIAIVVKKDILASDIVATIRKSEPKYLSDAYIFDVYEGEKVLADEKSIAIKLTFSADEALTDELINSKMKRIMGSLNYHYQASLRS